MTILRPKTSQCFRILLHKPTAFHCDPLILAANFFVGLLLPVTLRPCSENRLVLSKCIQDAKSQSLVILVMRLLIAARYPVSIVGDKTWSENKGVSLAIVSHLTVSTWFRRSLSLFDPVFSWYPRQSVFARQLPELTEMARQTPFTVYDLGRKKASKLGTPPSKISESRLSDEWRVARATRNQAAAGSKKASSRKKKKTLTGTRAKPTKTPKSAAELLRSDDGEDTCMECTFSSYIFGAPGAKDFASWFCDATSCFAQPSGILQLQTVVGFLTSSSRARS